MVEALLTLAVSDQGKLSTQHSTSRSRSHAASPRTGPDRTGEQTCGDGNPRVRSVAEDF
jgi:hypothetical protein